MNIDQLQQFIDSNGEYLIGNRMISLRDKTKWEAILLSPNVSREYWGKNIIDLPYKLVDKFANEELKSIIHLGKTYEPFQYGIMRKDFNQLTKVTCSSMELIIRCWQDNIKDYYKVIKVMEELTKTKK